MVAAGPRVKSLVRPGPIACAGGMAETGLGVRGDRSARQAEHAGLAAADSVPDEASDAVTFGIEEEFVFLDRRTLCTVDVGVVAVADGQRVPAGGRVVLDILATDTDERSWHRPGEFAPERFVDVDDYEAIATFIPHGGATVADGHRCPGEKLAIAGLAVAIAALSDARVTILGSGLRVNRRRLPTRPASGGRVRSADGAARCPVHVAWGPRRRGAPS